MRITRIYHPLTSEITAEFLLDKPASHHLSTVLRLPVGSAFELFTGDGSHYPATILAFEGKRVLAQLGEKQIGNTRSPFGLHLGQVISRGERMDFTIQKAVELGVSSITPLFSERCTVKLSGDRLEKKMAHWQGVVISACEQSGQDTLPKLNPAVDLQQWFPTIQEKSRLLLDPLAEKRFVDLPQLDSAVMLVGSEGGFSEQEISRAKQAGFIGLQLGPRILRTETAALTALSILQFRFGDL